MGSNACTCRAFGERKVYVAVGWKAVLVQRTRKQLGIGNLRIPSGTCDNVQNAKIQTTAEPQSYFVTCFKTLESSTTCKILRPKANALRVGRVQYMGTIANLQSEIGAFACFLEKMPIERALKGVERGEEGRFLAFQLKRLIAWTAPDFSD